MVKLYKKWSIRLFIVLLVSAGITSSLTVHAQLFEPNGLRIPGEWNGYTNSNPLTGPFNMTRIAPGNIYTTTFQYTDAPTSRQFKFASGNSGNPWGDQWRNTNFTPNTLQQVGVSFLGTPDNNNSLSGMDQNKYYTVNFNGNTAYSQQFSDAIFMETTNAPVNITNVTQLPASVTPSTSVAVTVTASSAPSPEEIVYVRYSTNNFTTSTSVAVTMDQAGNTQGTINIPGQTNGTIVAYYVFTSTVASVSSNHDMYTMRSNTNGGSNYVYTVAAAPPVNVVFRVNMANETVSSGVNLAGNFNGFSTSANPMTETTPGSKIYETTVALAVGANIEYKFVNGTNFESNLGAPCGNGSNRTYTVAGAATLPTVCFTQCANCVAPVVVTFRVDMATQTVSSGVSVSGSFNGYNTTANPMINVSGTLWEANITLPLGSYEFKFVNSGSYEGNQGAPCGNGNNRTVNVTGPATLPLVCYNSCSACPLVVPITFRVNLANVTVSGNGVHLAGSFNSFSTSANPMTETAPGSKIFTATVNVPANTSHTYKFLNDNSFGGVESVSAVCGTDDGFGGNNRNVSVATVGKVLPIICFSQCIDCGALSEWRGVSSNFNDGNNWTAGVPPTSCNFNIRIKETGVQPVIGGGTFSASSVALNSGATLTINSGATLNICGGLQGTNCNLTGAGTVNLNGTALQTIGGIVNVSNLRVENSSGVNLSPGTIVRVSGSLKLQNGFLNTTGGSFILAATPTSEARILKVESGSGITGNVSYQKYLAGINSTPNGGWYFLSSPVGGFPLNGFDQGGNNLHPATFLPTNPDPASIYLYSQTAAGSFDEFGWAKSNNPSQVLTSGSGARVWARKVTSNGVMQFTGAPFSGSLSLPITFCSSGCSNLASAATNGWNLVANPYPCPVDWNAATGWSKSGIASNAVRIWNAASGNYSSYDGTVSLNGGSQNIAAGQAFFVEATSGAASLSINEDAKANVYTSGLRTNVAPVDGIRIRVNNGGLIDEAWVDFSTERLNTAVSKLLNPGVNVSIGEGKGFCIAGLNTVSSNGVIPVGLKNNSNSFSFEFEKEGDFWTNNQIFLKDNMNGTLQEINQANQTFSFVSTGFDSDRFSLLVTQGVLSNRELNKKSLILVWPNPVKNFLSVDKAHLNEAFVIMDITGKKILSSKIEEGQSTINVENLPLGSYIIRFSNTGETARFNKN